jgi:hypothetical protein
MKDLGTLGRDLPSTAESISCGTAQQVVADIPYNNKKTMVFSPLANYADRAIAAGQRS